MRLTSRIPEGSSKRVFVEIWHEPPTTAGPGSFLDELITLAGGENIAADTEPGMAPVQRGACFGSGPRDSDLTDFNKEKLCSGLLGKILQLTRRGQFTRVNGPLCAPVPPAFGLVWPKAHLLHYMGGDMRTKGVLPGWYSSSSSLQACSFQRQWVL